MVTGTPSTKPKSSNTASKAKPGQEFLCKIRFKNPLPPLPFAPKLFTCTPPTSKYTDFKANSSWMKRQLYPLLTEDNAGLPLDFVQPSLFQAPTEPTLAEEDLPLMQPPLDLHKDAQQVRHRPLVPWLRRTEYISGEASKLVGRKSTLLESERLAKQKAAHPDLFERSLRDQIEAIRETFATSSQRLKNPQTIQHPRQPALHVRKVWPVRPDVLLASLQFTHGFFDDDPALKPLFKARHQWTQQEQDDRRQIDRQLALALLKPEMDATQPDQRFVGYFLPSLEQVQQVEEGRLLSSQQQQQKEGEEEIVYAHARNYNFRLVKEESNEKFLLYLNDQDARYVPIRARATFQKRRSKKRLKLSTNNRYQEASTSEDEADYPTHLVVRRWGPQQEHHPEEEPSSSREENLS